MEDYMDKLLDKKFRAQLKANPKLQLSKLVDADFEDLEYKVVESSKDIFYVVIPYFDSNIKQEDMQNILSAGATVGSAGSLSSAGCTVGTLGTVAGVTIGTFGTASTVGTLTTASSIKP